MDQVFNTQNVKSLIFSFKIIVEEINLFGENSSTKKLKYNFYLK